MSKYGITKEYFTDLHFLNEKNTLVYVGVFLLIFFVKGGLIPLVTATIGALLIAILANRFILNKRQPVPTKTAVIVTGTSSGIGQSAVLELSKQDFTVFATVRKLSDADVFKGKSNIIPVVMDVNQNDTITTAIQTIEEQLKSKELALLALVNNAGFAQTGVLESATDKSMHGQFDTNVFGLIAMTNATLPLLRKYSPKALKRGDTTLQAKVLNVSSVMGKFSSATAGLYAATKFAVEALSDSYRQELAKMDIQVVSIEPGAIKSSFSSTVSANQTGMNNLTHLDPDAHEYYRQAYEKLDASLEQQKATQAPPQIVADVIYDVIVASNPHPRYVAGKDGQIIIALLPWLWPSALDALTLGAFTPIDTIKQQLVSKKD